MSGKKSWQSIYHFVHVWFPGQGIETWISTPLAFASLFFCSPRGSRTIVKGTIVKTHRAAELFSCRKERSWKGLDSQGRERKGINEKREWGTEEKGKSISKHYERILSLSLSLVLSQPTPDDSSIRGCRAYTCSRELECTRLRLSDDLWPSLLRKSPHYNVCALN